MVFEKVKQMLAEQLDADIDSLTMETNIAKDLDADSLDVVEFILNCHKKFNNIQTVSI